MVDSWKYAARRASGWSNWSSVNTPSSTAPTFVLVAAETDHGTTARALRHMGLDSDALATAVRTEIDLVNNHEEQRA